MQSPPSAPKLAATIPKAGLKNPRCAATPARIVTTSASTNEAMNNATSPYLIKSICTPVDNFLHLANLHQQKISKDYELARTMPREPLRCPAGDIPCRLSHSHRGFRRLAKR